jgi:hypothetical protein
MRMQREFESSLPILLQRISLCRDECRLSVPTLVRELMKSVRRVPSEFLAPVDAKPRLMLTWMIALTIWGAPLALGQTSPSPTGPAGDTPAQSALAREVATNGWIVFSAKTDRGDWDLFVMRPDGSHRRRLTDTPNDHEAGARVSPDGRRLLYYRMPKSEPVANNTYGRHDLVIADADGQHAVVLGPEYPWATWSPDSQQIACLTPKGIQIIRLADIVLVIGRQMVAGNGQWAGAVLEHRSVGARNRSHQRGERNRSL